MKVPRSSLTTLLTPSVRCFPVVSTITPTPAPAHSHIPHQETQLTLTLEGPNYQVQIDSLVNKAFPQEFKYMEKTKSLQI